MSNTDKYANLDTETRDRILREVIDNAFTPASEVLSVPGIYEILSEHFNNDVLEAWEADQPTYEVVVGNIGTVYSGIDGTEAVKTFQSYHTDSLNGYGRAGGESVTLTKDDEIIREHQGTVDRG